MFAKKGYDGVSMREISEHSNVSKPTIYYYFGSKEGIYTELLQTGHDFMQKQILRILQQEISVKAKLAELLKLFFSEAVQHPHYVRFFISVSEKTADPHLPVRCGQPHKEGKERLIELLKEGVRTGEFGAGLDVHLAAEMLTGVMRHFVMMQLASEETILSDQLAENVIELLFKGLNE